MPSSIYLIGSLRNAMVPTVAEQLRNSGLDVFDDWYAAGPEADDYWQKYEIARGHNYEQALAGFAARHVYSFDLFHLNRCDFGVLVLPAGKSGHLELGYMVGRGKPCFILLDGQPERYDVMYQFVQKVVPNVEELISAIHESQRVNQQPNTEQRQRYKVCTTPFFYPTGSVPPTRESLSGSYSIPGSARLVDAPQAQIPGRDFVDFAGHYS